MIDESSMPAPTPGRRNPAADPGKSVKVWLPHVQVVGGGGLYTERLAQALRSLGHEVVTTEFAHRWQYFPWRLRWAACPEDVDVVMATSWWAFPFRRPGVKLVVIEHHCVNDPAFAPYRTFLQTIFHEVFLRAFTSLSLRAADAVVCVSRYTAESLAAAHGGIRAHVIPNGIETDYYCPGAEPKPSLGNRPVRLLFVGNLIRRKGADLLPKIMAALGPGYELRYTSGLRTRDTLSGKPGMVSLGRLTREQLREEYRKADLLLFPTRFEGFGYPAAEAMACGTPVVTTRCSSLPELVEDGVTGRLCPVDDVRALADAVAELSRDENALRAMGIKARSVAVSRFSMSVMAQRYAALLEATAGAP